MTEELVLGADGGVLDFVIEADRHPLKLIIQANEVAGLVSQSDLQQLPVPAALFLLLTSFKMATVQLIEASWPNPDDRISNLPFNGCSQTLSSVKKSETVKKLSAPFWI